ncbi:Ribonuclease R [Acaryochloris thomasi RCC1774]|uniref:Ribonuclease R n=1 Tax=Acaryochloris thomasi RCC1774 TaxID=1764569 RepID=A0A2W1J8K8_9CYAN|nr:RNB domain-containing ribonuclease [Acaryochloris thomasi]PZD70650.1 Ribonuclease R [Acaryochloris thomasi RCC1774]
MIEQRFSKEAITQAKTISTQHQPDLTRPQVQGITIDGPTSLDLDDAIWCEETDTGATIQVHISDVSDRIPLNSPLDQSAIATTQTRYYRQGNTPMLPRVLSENALSLQEGQPRATLTFELELANDGTVSNCKIFESYLISAKRFSYAQADYAIASPKLRWHSTLKLCQEWTAKLNQQRMATGAIGASAFGKNIYINEEGNLSDNPNAKYHSHRVIEEFMIAANTAAAQWLADRDQPALYRNHTAKAIAPGQDEMLQALLVLGSATAIRRRLQSWMNRAEYSPALIGHFALNLPAYGHFTSPIRRVADLINHRIIKALLRGEESPYTKQDLEELGRHINETVLEDERKTTTYYKDKAKQGLQEKLESEESFTELPEKEFSRLIKHAEGELPVALAEEVRSRLEQDRLVVLDYYLLLIQGCDLELQELVLKHLEGKVQDAASVLSMAVTQEESWEGLEYTELAQEGRFLAWAEVYVDGELRTSVEAGCDLRKQVARHRACWLWLSAFESGELVGVDARVVLELPVVVAVEPVVDLKEGKLRSLLEKPLLDGQNHVGRLIEICQAMGWELPTFEFEDRDDGFYCRCICGGVVGDAISGKKKLSKQRAAMGVLQKLPYADSKATGSS